MAKDLLYQAQAREARAHPGVFVPLPPVFDRRAANRVAYRVRTAELPVFGPAGVFGVRTEQQQDGGYRVLVAYQPNIDCLVADIVAAIAAEVGAS